MRNRNQGFIAPYLVSLCVFLWGHVAANVEPHDTASVHQITSISGISITLGSNTSGYTPARAQTQLLSHIEKCKKDSLSFTVLLASVARFSRQTGSVLDLHAAGEHAQLLLAPGALNEFTIDLGDLRVLPDPIRDGSGNFLQPTDVPKWAGTICSFLGHEIAEHLEQAKAGKRDRKSHHYETANKVEDKIVADYFGVERKRGEDCSLQHGNHRDVLIEIIGIGIERLHLTPKRALLGTDGAVLGEVDQGRLAYTTYETGSKFPGRASGSSACR